MMIASPATPSTAVAAAAPQALQGPPEYIEVFPPGPTPGPTTLFTDYWSTPTRLGSHEAFLQIMPKGNALERTPSLEQALAAAATLSAGADAPAVAVIAAGEGFDLLQLERSLKSTDNYGHGRWRNSTAVQDLHLQPGSPDFESGKVTSPALQAVVDGDAAWFAAGGRLVPQEAVQA